MHCTDCPVSAPELLKLLAAQRTALVAMLAPRIPRRLRSLVAAEDVVQEASLEALRSVATFRAEGADSLRRWVWRIARHRLCDLVKAQRRLKRGACNCPEWARQGDGSCLDAVADPDACPVSATTAVEDVAAVRRALAALPPAYRHALQLRYMEGLSVAAAAARLGRTTGAIQMLCNRGAKLLRRALEPTSRRACHAGGHLNGDTCEASCRTSIGRVNGSCNPDRVV